MEPTIYLPTRAIKKDDIGTMLELLRSSVPERYGIGLEIMGKPDDFATQENLESIAENIKSVPRAILNGVSVHGFSSASVYDGCEIGEGVVDLRTERGKQVLDRYISLGQSVEATYTHVHGGAGYKGELPQGEKAEALRKIKTNMTSCKSIYPLANFPIGIEVLPTPCMGDMDINPETVWHDCVESIDDCLAVVQDTDMRITLDTCHYGASIRDRPINLVEAGQKIGSYLGFLHISDTEGLWIPNESVFKEGVIPGEGRIGETSFAEFFSYIKQNHPSIGICIEVYNKDFQNPVESKEAIKRVVSWLDRG